MTNALDAKLSSALGDRSANSLKKAFGMLTVGDLLTHYPRRYARRGELTALSDLAIDENVTIVAEVIEVVERTMRQRKGSILEVRITDGKGILVLTFFNQAWRKNDLKPGVRGIFAGKVGDYRGTRQLAHPDYELFEAGDERDAGPEAKKWAMMPIPIYPATSTVASWQIAKALGVVLDTLPSIDDPVPASVRVDRELLDLGQAYQLIHRPENDAQWRRARDTLRFHEAFLLQAALLQRRAALREQPATPRIPGPELAGFDAALPFALTDDQRLVGDEITRDLAATVPMNRLVQGEVGSGKTLVAVRAMLTVAESGGQSALLAPTEVLAAQHLRSIVQTLGPDRAARMRPVLLTGQLPMAERRKALLAIASGASRIVIGTHALLGDQVQFADLGLVVVDEQHRFGVEQRESLRRKGSLPPHVLVLTATPIPRTVAMTVFGDLDVSTIATLPAGRIPIVSHVVPLADKPGWWNRVWARLGEELEQGRQGFVVVPAIDAATPEDDPDALADDPADGSADDTDAVARPPATVAELTPLLRSHPALAGRRVEPLHGRMSTDEKDATMQAFARGEIDVLVATTVIEVGVDVPNASTMVVADADRFGVSQLHQLRGRVGRGGVPGLCLFVTAAQQGSLARERVEAVAATLDGFELAQIDLELRREGDVLGANQSGGRSSLRLLRVATDGDLILQAREAAAEVLEHDATLSEHPSLKAALARRLDETDREFLAKN
ncbi:ATP-dependent DNA helicase RecG [Microcella sp.]|uniref:ATP-dependent DNA helicase RecG n=1 Tax=Microcella sp. TaxID=1913979 RepID=UPI00299F74F2|nr:ATP-dependent DNA helicase RecG [Microcella sp.]MDX2025180.1 ATP-dependent DNA helicase RecG [Microcella sp.]